MDKVNTEVVSIDAIKYYIKILISRKLRDITKQ